MVSVGGDEYDVDEDNGEDDGEDDAGHKDNREKDVARRPTYIVRLSA